MNPDVVSFVVHAATHRGIHCFSEIHLSVHASTAEVGGHV
jgi:hypothetical protein